jgi:hypothetical protein
VKLIILLYKKIDIKKFLKIYINIMMKKSIDFLKIKLKTFGMIFIKNLVKNKKIKNKGINPYF